MNDKLLLIAMVLAVALAGCGKQDDAEGPAAVTGAEQSGQPPSGGVVETVEEVVTESAAVIESNVESIKANIEKSQDQSTVGFEQLEKSVTPPKAPKPESAPMPEETVEEQVEVIEDKPAD